MTVFKPKVVITHKVHQEVLEYLHQHCFVLANQSAATLPKELIVERARDAQALMVFMPDHIDDAFLIACPSLQVVGAALKGCDNFDVNACTERGIWFSVVPDLLSLPTAELTLGLMIGLARHIGPGDEHIRKGDFHGWRPAFYGKSLAQSTVGIIGLGAVGQALAHLLKSFATRVVYFDKQRLAEEREQALRVYWQALDTLLGVSDFIVLILPMNPATYHLINAQALGKINPGAFLINTGRGSVVDENAVAEALAAGVLGGYAADVYACEDWALADRPRSIPKALLANRKQTLFTPHLGSAVAQTRLKIEMTAARNIVQALQGQVPENAINTPR